MDLAYLVAFGKRRFRWAVSIAARSLIECGGFRGEVVILSDRQGRGIRGVSWKVVKDPRARFQAKWMKHGVREIMDLPGFDRVLMLDSDILVRHRIDGLLERCDDRSVVCTNDMGNMVGQGSCGRCLTPEELTKYGATMRGVNSGFLLGKGRVMDRALRVWRNVQEESEGIPGEGFDQPALNAAIVRGLIHADMVPGLMLFPRRDPDSQWARPDAPFVHFHGIDRHLNRYLRMRKMWKEVRLKTEGSAMTTGRIDHGHGTSVRKSYFDL
jgi:hypothetical protein